MSPTPQVPRATKPAVLQQAEVRRNRRPAPSPVVGAGRGLPPVLAPKANVPLLPALSLHEPLQLGQGDARVDVDATASGHGDDVQAEADRAVGIRRGQADQRRPLGRAALVVVAVGGVDRPILGDVHRHHVAERLQLPAEGTERLRLGASGGARARRPGRPGRRVDGS